MSKGLLIVLLIMNVLNKSSMNSIKCVWIWLINWSLVQLKRVSVQLPPFCQSMICECVESHLRMPISEYETKSIWIQYLPPPAIVALISESSSSSPRIANCRWRGVIRFTFKSLLAFPANSSTYIITQRITIQIQYQTKPQLSQLNHN